ncbi:MAG: hypothetical protein ACM3VT_21980 [Solirubrobacterales bacterium]
MMKEFRTLQEYRARGSPAGWISRVRRYIETLKWTIEDPNARWICRYAPVAVATFTRDQILASGVRGLFELLDIHVPNLQWIRRRQESDSLGLREISSDRDLVALGMFNEDLNKRNYHGWPSDYRSHAAGVALGLIYRFSVIE